MSKNVKLENADYNIIKDYKNAFNEEEFKEKYTDYFDNYDYIFGDYSYDKLRLKGFNEKTNKEYRKVNAIEDLENYIKEYCAYDCRYFLLKKVK